MKHVIKTTNAPAAIGPYSQAIRKGPGLFLSGQLGLDPATGELVSANIKEQTRQALANLSAVLAEAGAKLEDVVKTTVFITHLSYFQDVNEVYGEVFNNDPPARSCVVVSALPKNCNVEIEAIAFI